MYGLWCFIGLIVIAGGLGGLVYTLSAPTSHSFRVPWHGKEFDSGFIGDIFIGICGAFVAIGAAIPVFELDVSVFELYWSTSNEPQGLIKPTIFVLAIGVVGGFSGLRMISGLSDAMLQKLEKEVKNLDTELKLNSQNDQKLRNDYKLLEGRFFIVSGQAAEGVSLIQEYLEDTSNQSNSKAWCWLAIGLKRIHKIRDALDAIQKAINIEPKNWLHYYNKACYQALLVSNEEISVQAVLETLKQSVRNLPLDRIDEVKEDIRVKDTDFNSIRDKPEFVNFADNLDRLIEN